jgi:hypothetical protein
MSSRLAQAPSTTTAQDAAARGGTAPSERAARNAALKRGSTRETDAITLPPRRAREEADEGENEATMHSIMAVGRRHQPRACTWVLVVFVIQIGRWGHFLGAELYLVPRPETDARVELCSTNARARG